MCTLWIWEQKATCATYSINWLVFITQMKSVYSAVRAGSLNKAVCALCFVFVWEQTATCATYSINWLVFVTEMKIVYSAVRTGSLNTTQVNVRFCSRDVAQAANLWPVISECRVRSQISQCEISGGQSEPGTGFSSSTSVSSCQHHSTNAPNSTLCKILLLPDGQTCDSWEPSNAVS